MTYEDKACLVIERKQILYGIPIEHIVRIMDDSTSDRMYETAVLLHDEGIEYKLSVDKIDEVIELSRQDIYEVPEEIVDESNQYLSGVVYRQEKNRLLFLLDGPELIHFVTEGQEGSGIRLQPSGSFIQKEMQYLPGTYLRLRLGDTEFVLPTDLVCEILSEFVMMKKPGGKPWMDGVLYYQNRVLSVVLLARGKPQLAVICERGTHRTAFLASEVEEIITVTEEMLLSPDINTLLPEKEVWGKTSDSIGRI